MSPRKDQRRAFEDKVGGAGHKHGGRATGLVVFGSCLRKVFRAGSSCNLSSPPPLVTLVP